jgi:hypothetical protein
MDLTLKDSNDFSDDASLVEQTFASNEVSQLLGYFLARGDVTNVHVDQAVWRDALGIALVPNDRFGAHLSFFALPDWPFPALRVRGYYDRSRALIGFDADPTYPPTWSVHDVQAFRRGLTQLRERALCSDNGYAAVSAALQAKDYDLARTLVSELVGCVPCSVLCDVCLDADLEGCEG